MIQNTYCIYILTVVMLFVTAGCTTYDSNIIHNSMSEEVDTYVTIGKSINDVKAFMQNEDVAYQDDSLLVYNMNDYRKLLVCQFYDNKLDALVMYIYQDMVSWNAIRSLFPDYEVITETESQVGLYVNRDKNLYAEVCSERKDGIKYYCLGISAIRLE